MKKTPLSIKEGKLAPLILRLAIPNTLGLLVVSAYSLADSFFVSSLGADATAAVGVTFSLHVLMQAVGYTLGMGAGSLLSRALGREAPKDASRYAAVAFLEALLVGTLITAAGLFFRTPILRLLGTSDAILEPAVEYVTPLFLSAPAMCGTFVLSQLLRAEGHAVYAMVGLASGSLLNIALDPLFISLLGLGIKGASIATLISQTVGFFVLLSAFLRRKSTLDIFKKEYLLAFSQSGRILVAGLPSLLRQGLSGLSTVLLTRTAATFGDGAVSAVSLVTRLFLLVFAFCLGIGQGMMPVVGYSHGAGNPTRMKKAYTFSCIASSVVMLLLGGLLFMLAPPILSLFGAEEEALRIGILALRAQSTVLCVHGIITSTILFLQATGHSLPGSLLAAGRQGIFFLPLIFLLPSYFGETGLILTQPISDALTFLLTIPFLVFSVRALNKEIPPDARTPKKAST